MKGPVAPPFALVFPKGGYDLIPAFGHRADWSDSGSFHFDQTELNQIYEAIMIIVLGDRASIVQTSTIRVRGSAGLEIMLRKC